MLCLASVAHADGWYFGVGAGGPAKLNDDIGDWLTTQERGGSGRIVVGRRAGGWAIEGALFGTDLLDFGQDAKYTTFTAAVDLKYHVPIIASLELYVRGGLDVTSLAPEDPDSDRATFKGRGVDYGAGLQLPFGISSLRAAVWVDFGRQFFRLRNEDKGESSLDGDLSMATVGLSFGSGL